MDPDEVEHVWMEKDHKVDYYWSGQELKDEKDGEGVVGTYLLFHVFPFVESSLISGKLIAPVVVLTNIALGRYAFYFKKRRIK